MIVIRLQKTESEPDSVFFRTFKKVYYIHERKFKVDVNPLYKRYNMFRRVSYNFYELPYLNHLNPHIVVTFDKEY